MEIVQIEGKKGLVFNYADIKKEFEEGKEFIHLRAVRQKTQVNYDTFIGSNAVEALKTYFEIRKRQGEVFNDKTRNSITSAVQRYIAFLPFCFSQGFQTSTQNRIRNAR